MRPTAILAGSVWLACATMAAGQSQERPREQSAGEIADVKQRVADWLKTCLTDWDRETHMTKREWDRTCKRVAAERERFLLANPDMAKADESDPRLRRR